MKLRKILVLALFALVLCSPAQAAEKIRIVTTTSNLADFTRAIVGDSADIYSVAAPSRDIHFIQPTPRDVLKVKKAQVLVHNGLDLEAWREPLLEAAGNVRFLGHGSAAIDASQGVTLLEIPQSLSRAQGDIHLYGNPHYWTDPENAKIMIGNIQAGLARLYPDQAGIFKARADKLKADMHAKLADWSARLKPYAGTAIVTYHNSWPYFARRFGFEIVGFIEPKPGIPPTARHLRELLQSMKEKQAKVVIKEAFHERRAAERVAREAGVPMLTLYQFSGQEKTSSYIEVMEKNVEILEKALSRK